MLTKSRIHDVAKDLQTQSNVLIPMLKDFFADPPLHSTLLEEKHIDFILEQFSKENEVKSFDDYFNEKMPDEVRAKRDEDAKAKEKAKEAKKPVVKKTTVKGKTVAAEPKAEKQPAKDAAKNYVTEAVKRFDVNIASEQLLEIYQTFAPVG